MSIISDVVSPIKSYLLAGAGIALISGAGYFAYHERHVEHAKDVAAETKEVAKVQKQDTVITQAAAKDISQDEAQYNQTVSAPAHADIGVVCHDTRPDPLPAPAAAHGAGHAPPDSGAGDTFDPSGPLLDVGRKYDAWVIELQQENATLRQELEKASKR
jgi:hypothetical protein